MQSNTGPNTKAALAIEGGSFSTIYAAGAVDVLMEHQIWFEYVNGVSAGALTAYDYIARLPGRVREYNEKLCCDPRFLGIRNFIRTGNLFDFDYMYRLSDDDLRAAENQAVLTSTQTFEVGATNCRTGEITFFSKSRMPMEKFRLACKASASIPEVTDVVPIDGDPYLDGGCACPVPFQRPIDLGYRKVMVIVSHDKTYTEHPAKPSVERIIMRKYAAFPKFLSVLMRNCVTHHEHYQALYQLKQEGRIFLMQPSGGNRIRGLERDPRRLEKLYQEGRADMEKRLPEFQKYLNS